MDLRYAWRSLLRTPGFSLLIVATLALGIGATTTMFSAVWAVLLRPLPFPDQQQLVTIWQADPGSPAARQRVTPADFVDWDAQTTSFAAMGALPNWTGEPWIFNAASGEGFERVPGIHASSGVFQALGVEPLLGRALNREDDRTRGVRSVAISYGYWQTRFGGDTSVV